MALRAVDTFVAVARIDSPIFEGERVEAGLVLVDSYFGALVRGLQKCYESGTTPSRKLVQTIKIVLAANTAPERLIACLVIIEMWLPQLRDPYQNFFRQVLGKDLAVRMGLIAAS